MISNAILSDCGLYRYWLSRSWGSHQGPIATFVMLNPSTADYAQDDPTIRRCIGFAKRDGLDRLQVVNLFAYRATKPADLPSETRMAIGQGNYDHVYRAIAGSHGGPIIAAWGANKAAQRIAPNFLHGAACRGVDLKCLGVSKDGSPRHPLMVRKDQPIVGFP